MLLVFLKSWRATLIASLSIPLSLVISFVFLVSDRRHAQFDVARRPGGGHRSDHRRHGGGGRKYRPASGRRANRRCRGRRAPAAKSAGPSSARRLTTILVFLPLALVQRRRRAVLSIAEPRADRGTAGFDGRQPDDHSRAGRPLSWRAGRCRPPARSITCWPIATKDCCASGCAFRELGVLAGAAGGVAGWLAVQRISKPASCPRWTKGPWCIDYHMPVGTSLAPDRQSAPPGRRRAAAHARRLGLHPPRPVPSWGCSPRNRTRGDILVSLKPAGAASAGERNLRLDLREELKQRSARAGNRIDSAGPGPDQRSGRRRRCRSKSKSSVPIRPSCAASPAEVGEIVEEVAGSRRRQRARVAGQSRHRRAARQRADGPRRPDRTWTSRRQLNAALYGQVAQHDPRTGPDDENPRPLSRPRPLRQRPWARLPISPAPAAAPRHCTSAASATAASARRISRHGIGFVPLGAIRHDRSRAQPQRTVARKPAAGDHRHRPSCERDLGSVNHELQATQLRRVEISRRAIAGNWPATIAASKNRSPAC